MSSFCLYIVLYIVLYTVVLLGSCGAICCLVKFSPNYLDIIICSNYRFSYSTYAIGIGYTFHLIMMCKVSYLIFAERYSTFCKFNFSLHGAKISQACYKLVLEQACYN